MGDKMLQWNGVMGVTYIGSEFTLDTSMGCWGVYSLDMGCKDGYCLDIGGRDGVTNGHGFVERGLLFGHGTFNCHKKWFNALCFIEVPISCLKVAM